MGDTQGTKPLIRNGQLRRSVGRNQSLHYWPLQDILLLLDFCERASYHYFGPFICNAHTVAIVLRDYCARYAPPPTPLLYTLHHTISGMAILCKGQGPLQDIRLLLDSCARIHHPHAPPAHLHCPPWCNTIAWLLGSIRLPLRTPVCMLYTIQYW